MLALVRRLDAMQVKLGGERLSPEFLRAQNPTFWREVDKMAPGFVDVFIAAVAGDAAALARLEKVTACPAEPTRTLQ